MATLAQALQSVPSLLFLFSKLDEGQVQAVGAPLDVTEEMGLKVDVSAHASVDDGTKEQPEVTNTMTQRNNLMSAGSIRLSGWVSTVTTNLDCTATGAMRIGVYFASIRVSVVAIVAYLCMAVAACGLAIWVETCVIIALDSWAAASRCAASRQA